jgi:glutamine synthetase
MIALERAGLEVEQGHAESSLNQFEISVAPLPAVAAADSLICAKEIIKEVATAHGFAALFLPKPFHSLLPTGLHFHLSIHHPSGDPEAIPLRDYVSSQTREKHSISKDVSHNFLAGILHRLSPIMAFSTPSDNSYLRLATEDVMGKYICWGRNNSSVPLNEISVGYWEIRSLDWTANIHLAMAAYISAGLLGIKEHQQLQCQDSGTLTYQLEPSARESLGIVDLLPQDFEQANLSLISRRYAGLQHYINEELIDLYVLVKEKERQYLSNLTDDDKLSLLFQHF